MRNHWLSLLCLAACTRTTNLASSVEDAAVARPDAAPVACVSSPCAACENGLDDDGDGLTDGFDPECTSPGDQFENSFASGVHGEDQSQKCRDCFFDDNSGGGDDGCGRAESCATTGTSESGTGACKSCAVEAMCSASCEPLVPNGCDCFGCCGVWRGGAEIHVLLASSCSLETLDVPGSCSRCEPAPDCGNPCGRCELCPGRSIDQLPADCMQPNGFGYTCDDSNVCERSSDCAASEYCQQGCCLAIGI